ncbi:hypothetical protein BpOF4_06505 [Alkalihalophilus pseudofirmus OF4]|uniref:Uncharacterized protein n=1 Tax=Alkalihalophilus pseudofirmus (strain ATCC BAA-2126 / JCM 17055 / OF4) TaxID=398511 RepID=D3G084_ALKPO|nr:hypothetical protein BpOF4_06505 [Alkalihalophilus pseudofirmus OF4]
MTLTLQDGELKKGAKTPHFLLLSLITTRQGIDWLSSGLLDWQSVL